MSREKTMERMMDAWGDVGSTSSAPPKVDEFAEMDDSLDAFMMNLDVDKLVQQRRSDTAFEERDPFTKELLVPEHQQRNRTVHEPNWDDPSLPVLELIISSNERFMEQSAMDGHEELPDASTCERIVTESRRRAFQLMYEMRLMVEQEDSRRVRSILREHYYTVTNLFGEDVDVDESKRWGIEILIPHTCILRVFMGNPHLDFLFQMYYPEDVAPEAHTDPVVLCMLERKTVEDMVASLRTRHLHAQIERALRESEPDPQLAGKAPLVWVLMIGANLPEYDRPTRESISSCVTSLQSHERVRFVSLSFEDELARFLFKHAHRLVQEQIHEYRLKRMFGVRHSFMVQQRLEKTTEKPQALMYAMFSAVRGVGHSGALSLTRAFPSPGMWFEFVHKNRTAAVRRLQTITREQLSMRALGPAASKRLVHSYDGMRYLLLHWEPLDVYKEEVQAADVTWCSDSVTEASALVQQGKVTRPQLETIFGHPRIGAHIFALLHTPLSLLAFYGIGTEEERTTMDALYPTMALFIDRWQANSQHVLALLAKTKIPRRRKQFLSETFCHDLARMMADHGFGS